MINNNNFLWDLLVELRKEVLLAQETRAKILGFKITFVSASIGLIYANIEKINSNLLIIPAVAAIFFDILINSYSMSTKRIGYYCRKYLEPGLISPERMPKNGFLFWEEFVNQKELKQRFSLFGNLGLTLIVVIVSIINGFYTLHHWQAYLLMIFLSLLFAVDAYAHAYPTRKINKLKLKEPEIDYSPLFSQNDE